LPSSKTRAWQSACRGRYAGLRAWRTGLVMVVLGVVVEAIVIALGG
jgi:hypothetical protein